MTLKKATPSDYIKPWCFREERKATEKGSSKKSNSVNEEADKRCHLNKKKKETDSNKIMNLQPI